MGTLGISCKGLLYLLNGLPERVTGSLLTAPGAERVVGWMGHEHVSARMRPAVGA